MISLFSYKFNKQAYGQIKNDAKMLQNTRLQEGRLIFRRNLYVHITDDRFWQQNSRELDSLLSSGFLAV